MKRAVFLPRCSGFLFLVLLFFSLTATAAKLEVDRSEISLGEIATVTLKGAPLIAVVEWKASPELEIVESNNKRARVKGVREGSGSVRCEMNMSVRNIDIQVRRPAAPIVSTPPVAPPRQYLTPTLRPATTASDPDSLAGTWQITANGYQGKLELASNQSMLNGRVWFDAIGAWEPLADLYFDAAIGELSFTRPGANQSYRGQLQGNQLQGKFTQWGGRGYSAATPSYDWNASRAGATAATPPTLPPRGRPSGLIAHLTMDGPVTEHVSGRPADNHGAQPTRDRQGRDGGALLFDGRSYLEIPLDINPATRPQLTIAAWVRADSDQAIQQVASHDNGGYDRSLNIDYRGGGTGWSAFAGSGAVLGVKPVQVGKWSFVAAVWDQTAQTVRLYVDGSMVEKAGSCGDGMGFLRIGMNPGFGEYFKGAIDELWVFDRALGQNEISRLRGKDSGRAGNVNLALNKPASQSSRSQWSRPNDPQGAVDGVINGSYAFHTDNQPNPWWQVDLGGTYALSEVRLYNRLDCCAERARSVQVMLSGDGRDWRTVYRHDGSVFGGKDGNPLRVPLRGEQARYVRLQLNETIWFHLDEVEVMGTDAGHAGNTGASLNLSRDRYAPGESIVVNFTAPASYPNDAWIGIIPSRIPHGSEAENDRHDLTYQYVQKRTSGNMTFTAPTAPGNYDLRLHDTDSNGKEVALVSFTVENAVPYGGGRGYTADRPGDGGRGYSADRPNPGPNGAPGMDDELQRQLNLLRDMYKR